jgi:hypothetical protein
MRFWERQIRKVNSTLILSPVAAYYASTSVNPVILPKRETMAVHPEAKSDKETR